MFAPCPHCGYLIALIATRERITLDCPRCHNLVEPGATSPPVRSVPAPQRTPDASIDNASSNADAEATPEARPVRDAPRETAAPSPRAESTARAPSTETPTDAIASAPVASQTASAAVDAAADARDDASVSAPGDAATATPAKPLDAAPAGSRELDPPLRNDPPQARSMQLDAATTGKTDDATAAPAEVAVAAPASPRVARSTRAQAPRRNSPSFVRATPATSTPGKASRRWPARIAALALALLLALQLLLAQRDALAASAQWRPAIAGLCSVGLCTLPPWRDPAAFTMLSRNVAPVPGTGELAVSARFRNDAPWPQAWPHLHLVLSDAQGRPAAARVLAPREYAGDAAKRPIAPQQSVDASARVREPEPATVAFAFDFR